MAVFRYMTVIAGEEQRSLPLTIRQGYIIEAISPSVSYNPLLGVDVVRHGTGLRTYGAGILTSVRYELDATWPGTIDIVPFLDDPSIGRVNGARTSISNINGRVTISNPAAPLWGLDQWGELYYAHGVTVIFQGDYEGKLRGLFVLLNVRAFPATPTIVGDNAPL